MLQLLKEATQTQLMDGEITLLLATLPPAVPIQTLLG
jgi:hypothetical protein